MGDLTVCREIPLHLKKGCLKVSLSIQRVSMLLVVVVRLLSLVRWNWMSHQTQGWSPAWCVTVFLLERRLSFSLRPWLSLSHSVSRSFSLLMECQRWCWVCLSTCLAGVLIVCAWQVQGFELRSKCVTRRSIRKTCDVPLAGLVLYCWSLGVSSQACSFRFLCDWVSGQWVWWTKPKYVFHLYHWLWPDFVPPSSFWFVVLQSSGSGTLVSLLCLMSRSANHGCPFSVETAVRLCLLRLMGFVQNNFTKIREGIGRWAGWLGSEQKNVWVYFVQKSPSLTKWRQDVHFDN